MLSYISLFIIIIIIIIVKCKSEFIPLLNQEPRQVHVWKCGVTTPRILNFRPYTEVSDRFTRESNHTTFWVDGWVGCRTSLDGVEKRKVVCTCKESHPNTSIIQPVH